jgi:hypothetical protein
MILTSEVVDRESLAKRSPDVCFYGLGFETRSTHVVGLLNSRRVFALQMPFVNIHSYSKNVIFARTRKHEIVTDFEKFLRDQIQKLFSEGVPVSIALDISSLNRTMMMSLLAQIAACIRCEDRLSIYYSAAAYREPDWRFPQIDRIGPVIPEFTAYDSNPLLPLCLILGLGFEPGVSMGIINQLEPRLSYCFWGSGVDVKYDADVQRANFDFDFPGFRTKTVSFPVKDPRASYFLLESLTAGLIGRYNVLFVPMGPKIFSLLTALIGLTYRGKVAIWRAQQPMLSPPDAVPSAEVVVATIDTALLNKLGKGRLKVTALESA